MGIGLEDYKTGPKNNSRRLIANAVKDLLKELRVPVKDATVIYLPGPTDLETDVLLEKGFRPWNMYAVENNPAVAKKLRKGPYGKLRGVIEGDIWDVARALRNRGDSTDVIMADLTCPLTDSVVLELCRLGLKGPQVLSLTLQKGRENPAGKNYVCYGLWKEYAPKFPTFWSEEDGELPEKFKKNRLLQAMALARWTQWYHWCMGNWGEYRECPDWAAWNKAIGGSIFEDYRAAASRPLMCRGVLTVNWRVPLLGFSERGFGHEEKWTEFMRAQGYFATGKANLVEHPLYRTLNADRATRTKRWGKR